MNIDVNSVLQSLSNPLLFPHLEKFVWIFIGVTFTAAIYSFTLFIFLKDINYLNYFLHILSINYINFAITGFGEKYIWSSYPSFTKMSLPLSHGLSVISVIVFTDYFLNMKENIKFVHNFFKYFVFIPVIMMIVSLFSFDYSLVFIPFMGITLSIFLIMTAVVSITKELPGAKFYLLSMFSICCGGVLYSLQSLGFFAGNPTVKYSLQIGAIVETIFLSFALSARVRALQREKESIARKSMAQAKKIQELVEVSFDCYWETDKKGYFRFLSENIYKQLGYKNLEVIFRRPEELFAEGAPIELKEQFVASMNSRASFRDIEIMSQTKDGNFFWLKANATMRLNDDNEFDGYVGAFINATVSKYKQYEDYVATNTKSLSRIAGAIAHEINNPLAFLQLCIDLMEHKNDSLDEVSDKKFKSNLEKMKKSTLKISGIISKLQGMVANESGILPSKCRLSDVIKMAIKFCEFEIKSYNIRCDFLFAENENEIYIKKEDICKALINLIHNSIEATEKSENPWIKITLENLEDEIVVTLTDSGKGIPFSQRISIFEPFFTTKDFKNLGLGLTQAMQFVERNGGSLSLDPHSKETKFILKFNASVLDPERQELESN